MLEKETQKHIRLDNLLRMFSESSFIESSIFDLESGFSIVESGFLKRESEHKSGFFPSPDFLRVRVQVRVRVRSGFRSMPSPSPVLAGIEHVTRTSAFCQIPESDKPAFAHICPDAFVILTKYSKKLMQYCYYSCDRKSWSRTFWLFSVINLCLPSMTLRPLGKFNLRLPST